LLLEAPARAHAARLLAERTDADDMARREAEWLLEYASYHRHGIDTVEQSAMWKQALAQERDATLKQFEQQIAPESRQTFAALSLEKKIELYIGEAVKLARAALETERRNIAGAIARAHSRGEHILVMNLTEAIGNYLDISGYWRDLNQFCGWALEAAHTTGEERTIATWTHRLKRVSYNLGERASAGQLDVESEALLSGIDQQKDLFIPLYQEGIQALENRSFEAALSYFQQCLKIAETTDDQANIGLILHAMGNVGFLQDNNKAALVYYQRSLEIRKAQGDQAGVGDCLGQLGMVAQVQGDYDMALGYYQSGFKIYESLGYQSKASILLHQIGAVAQARGDYGALEY
jgi:tetratricopeptide (TPR) repeat protein